MQAERVFDRWITSDFVVAKSIQVHLFGIPNSHNRWMHTYSQSSVTAVRMVHVPAACIYAPLGVADTGTVLALLCLSFVALRFVAKHFVPDANVLSLDSHYSVERVMPWVLLAGFVLLSLYSATSGVSSEFGLSNEYSAGWNIAGFPHQEAYGLGSWIILGLLTILMLSSAWMRKQRIYLYGALLTLLAAIPLISSRFETELATATAWRVLAAMFLALGSLLVWCRKRIQFQQGWSMSVRGAGSTELRPCSSL